MEINDRLHRLIRSAAKSAHPVFVANGWKWRHGRVPSEREIIDRLEEMVGMLDVNTTWIHSHRFVVGGYDADDPTAGIRIQLDLGIAWNAEWFPEPEYDLVR